jgi:hypothetical protein
LRFGAWWLDKLGKKKEQKLAIDQYNHGALQSYLDNPDRCVVN